VSCSRIVDWHYKALNWSELYIKIQPVPRSEHTVSSIKTNQLMLHREVIVVCSQIHTIHLNTLCGLNVEFVNVKLAVHTVATGL